MADPQRVAVWDPLVRVAHWTVAGAVGIALLSGHSLLPIAWHEPAGYTALAAAGVRLLWGLFGGRHARFHNFLPSRATLRTYTATVLAHRDLRYLGHNPLGAMMIVALMACLVALGATGWLFNTDAFWGERWLDLTHQVLSWTMLALVAIHVAGVIFTGLRHRENLVASMIHGRKRVPSQDDIA